MKTAEEYLDELLPLWIISDYETLYQHDDILLMIKQAQIDAYNQGVDEAVKMCAENARVKPVNTSSSIYWNPDNLDKQSILDCAEILKKQLWKQMN